MPARHLRPSSKLSFCATLVVATGTLAFFAAVALADGVRGGNLYDKWWVVNGAPAPEGDHPLYPEAGQKSGDTTFRCKECHGWDYKGADGAYGSGSHFTGIPGVFQSTLSPAEMFALLQSPDGDGSGGTVVNGHDYGSFGLSDTDILDLVDMLQEDLIDTDDFIDESGVFFTGDDVQGALLWETTGTCIFCHGDDGTLINFGTPESPEYVGTIASHNPWEFMHKVRFGQPGSAMPSWLLGPGDDQSVADMGSFAATLPTGICAWVLGDVDGDANTVLGDAIYALAFLFQSGPAPVPDEEAANVNGDEIVDLVDVFYLLEYLFLGGPPLLPSPTC